ncbi:response regulator transcription factor [Sulfurospirillum arcachonense]|uniref:response regulator transcription factor n=1 Tax=Sulfurospirillum arcachonense TaxID=57666 RepID=UPI000469406D|nr:response regulator [Sulfurospirillum arcachonense]
MLTNVKILYAEDEELIRQQMVKTLEFLSARVISVSDGNAAYEAYNKENPNIIIADIEMPGMSGLELAEKIRQNDKNSQIIITTAYTNTEYFLKAIELNLVKYLLKPIKLLDLEEALNICCENLCALNTYERYFNDKDYYSMRLGTLVVNGEEIPLEFQEKAFLELLLTAPKEIVVYKTIEEKIWPNGMTDAALRTLVFNLRKKLPDKVIKNISKTGYKIVIKE